MMKGYKSAWIFCNRDLFWLSLSSSERIKAFYKARSFYTTIYLFCDFAFLIFLNILRIDTTKASARVNFVATQRL